MQSRLKAAEAVSIRKIRGSRETPLIVPGFSSLVGQKIGTILSHTKESLDKAYLVSAFDIHYRLVSTDDLWLSEILFVDSGNFESSAQANFREPKKWSLNLYNAVIKSLLSDNRLHVRPSQRIVLVNFDTKTSLSQQLSQAKDFFGNYSQTAHDFLCKPEQNDSPMAPIGKLTENVSALEEFDILGFTEKELGTTVLQKCESLVRIRNALRHNGIDKPIHIFGCSDPISIVTFFLCGADIFDGISWLKMGFHEDMAIYENNYSLLKGRWTESENVARAREFLDNLHELNQLYLDMRQFALTHKMKSFRMSRMKLAVVQSLVSRAGVDLEAM